MIFLHSVSIYNTTTGRLAHVGKPGRRRRNEEGAWGFGVGRLARVLGLLKQGELVRGWVYGLHLETPFITEPMRGEGKNIKTKS